MDSVVTVATARSQLSGYVPNSPMEFLDKINQCAERLLYGGKFNGAFVIVAFDAASGFITLPPRYLGILAGTYDRVPVQTFSQWQPYQEYGWCTTEEAGWWRGRLQDLGDGYVTTVDVDEAGPLKVYSSAGDDDLIVRLFGEDADTGQPVVDANGIEGENVTLAAPSITTTHNFASLTGIQKPHTKSPIVIKVDPTNGDAEYTISTVQPWETIPSWRRYQVGPGEKTVRVLCQRRFIPARDETDYIYPGSIGALKMGLKALSLEDSGYESIGESQQCWKIAYQILNQEAKSTRAGGQIPIPTFSWGFGQGIPQTN